MSAVVFGQKLSFKFHRLIREGCRCTIKQAKIERAYYGPTPEIPHEYQMVFQDATQVKIYP